jgi:very-short-patch-repair endonuclease
MNLKKRSEVKKNIYKKEVSESEPELLLFEKLVQKGYRPEKQFKTCGYFLDLSYPEFKIAIEYDGKHHQETGEYDVNRQKVLEKNGWKVFRISNVGLHKGIFKLTNCWGKNMGTYSKMELAMDDMIKEIIWFLRRYGYDDRKKENTKTMKEHLFDFLVRIEKKQ